jgi:hypothetical protein
MDLDAEHRALVRKANFLTCSLSDKRLTLAKQNLRSIYVHVEGTRRTAWRSLMQHWIEGEENGTRNFAVAAGCAYPDHHFVVAVLWPLSGRS